MTHYYLSLFKAYLFCICFHTMIKIIIEFIKIIRKRNKISVLNWSSIY